MRCVAQMTAVPPQPICQKFMNTICGICRRIGSRKCFIIIHAISVVFITGDGAPGPTQHSGWSTCDRSPGSIGYTPMAAVEQMHKRRQRNMQQ